MKTCFIRSVVFHRNRKRPVMERIHFLIVIYFVIQAVSSHGHYKGSVYRNRKLHSGYYHHKPYTTIKFVPIPFFVFFPTYKESKENTNMKDTISGVIDSLKPMYTPEVDYPEEPEDERNSNVDEGDFDIDDRSSVFGEVDPTEVLQSTTESNDETTEPATTTSATITTNAPEPKSLSSTTLDHGESIKDMLYMPINDDYSPENVFSPYLKRRHTRNKRSLNYNYNKMKERKNSNEKKEPKVTYINVKNFKQQKTYHVKNY